MENRKIRVAITHGDTNGIGYEVIFKALANPIILEMMTPIVYGSPKVASYHHNLTTADMNFSIISSAEEAQDGRINLLTVFDDDVRVEMGHPSKEAGRASFLALERAVEDYRKGLYDVLVTAPINKDNIQSEDFHFCGHTEYLEEKLGDGNKSLMILMNDELRVALVTTHLPISQVASAITKEAIVEKATIFSKTLKRDLRFSDPRIAILSLNPHCGDGGLLGAEEQDVIVPAIEQLEADGIKAFGPFAADGFFASKAYQAFDGVLAMYHDQGLAPFKVIAGEEGVNFTAGLPVVRTSPDHGTAYDIAGKDKADGASMRHAIYLAIDVARNRKAYDEPLQNPLPKLYKERRDESEKVRFVAPPKKKD